MIEFLEFQDVQVRSFNQIWKNIDHYIFKYFFIDPTSSPLGTAIISSSVCFKTSHSSEMLSSYIFLSFIFLLNIYIFMYKYSYILYVFKLVNLFFFFSACVSYLLFTLVYFMPQMFQFSYLWVVWFLFIFSTSLLNIISLSSSFLNKWKAVI